MCWFPVPVVLSLLSLLSRVIKQSRKGILLFSSISLVNCMSAFCLLRSSGNLSISSLCTAVKVTSTYRNQSGSVPLWLRTISRKHLSSS